MHRITGDHEQLTLDVGGAIGRYVKSAFSLSGKVETFTTAIDRDEEVMITATDADGEVLFRSAGWVKGVTIETIPPSKANPFRGTLRKHSIKLGESAPGDTVDE